MTSIRIAASAVLAAAFSFGLATAAQAQNLPAMQQNWRGDCSSNGSLMHVHRRLDGAIDRLQHDQHDYDGHREQAIDKLQQARAQLADAEQSAVTSAHDNRNCFRSGGATGGSDRQWGRRGDRTSDRSLHVVRVWVERLIDQLQRDNHDYGGHRVQAIADMQAARTQLLEAERYDTSHGR